MVFVSYKFNTTTGYLKNIPATQLLNFSIIIGRWISQKMNENGIEFQKNDNGIIYFDCRHIGIYDNDNNCRKWGSRQPYIQINADLNEKITGISIRSLTHIGDDKIKKIVDIVDEFWSKMDL